MKLFFRYILFFLFLFGCKPDEIAEPSEMEFEEIKIMSYNVLYSTSNDETLEVLRKTDADIIGIQETSPARLMELAQKLHYHYHSFSKTPANLSDQDTGILSRFPIVKVLSDGVVVKINSTLNVAIFTVHLSPYPYEPYDFRDGKITTAEQAIASASANRIPEIDAVLEQIDALKKENIPVFLTGDFNEPSHLDWTAATAEKNLHFDKIVEWPVSKKIGQSGLKDVYRLLFPNPANFPGNTWTTIEAENEVYDRIDIIYQSEEKSFTIRDIRLVGGVGDVAGIVVDNYPSDHYSVLATYKLEPL